MFRRDHQVFHPGVLCDAHPFGRVELLGVELRCELLVLRAGDIGPRHDPLADLLRSLAVVLTRRHGIETPVDEHTEARVAPPRHARIALTRRLRRCLRVLHISCGCRLQGDASSAEVSSDNAGDHQHNQQSFHWPSSLEQPSRAALPHRFTSLRPSSSRQAWCSGPGARLLPQTCPPARGRSARDSPRRCN